MLLGKLFTVGQITLSIGAVSSIKSVEIYDKDLGRVLSAEEIVSMVPNQYLFIDYQIKKKLELVAN